MARIQLRDTTIYIQDGLSGSSLHDLPNSAFALIPMTSVDGVPATSDEIQTFKQYQVNPAGGTFTLSGENSAAETWTTAAIAYNATATTIETAIDLAATGQITGWINGDITVSMSGAAGLSDGTVTLTFDGVSVTQENHLDTVINGDSLTGVVATGLSTIAIDTNVLNGTPTTAVPVGARFQITGETGSPVHTVTAVNQQRTETETTQVTFTPAVASAVADNATITWLPQRLTVKIGDGDLTWTEAREMIYDLDRDLLDTVRQGEEQPVEIDLNFIFDFVTTETGQAITPVDALKRINEASAWVSSATDLCEPYAVDIFVVHCLPCGTDQDEELLFSDFRYESLEYSVRDASIAVSGRCNITDVQSTRTATGDGCV
jgi:hypothetical protein